MISKAEVRPGAGVRYLFRGVMVGDGHRAAGTRLRAAQDEAGVPPGVWKGRGLAALGLVAGDVVSERQAELLLGEGRHPDADRIERELLAQGKSPARARRATVLGRPIEHNASPKTEKAKERTPWLAMDLVFRAPSTAHIAWALADDETRLVLESCQDVARDRTLAWLEKSVVQIRWGSGGTHRRPVKDGLVVAVFRHCKSRAAEPKPLLHDHAVVSIRARRPHDGEWGNLSADSLMANIVAADTLYTLHFMEEVTARLGWAWEPREVTPGRRPVMEIAGIDRRLIGWQSTRRQQIEDALPVLTDKYEERHGYPPGEKAGYALACHRRLDPPAQAHGAAVADRAADAMAHLRDPGVRRLHRLPARRAGAGGGRGGVGAGAAGRRRCPGGRGHRRRGLRDARRLRAPPPARRGPPPPLLRPARPTPRTRPGRTDRADGPRRLHPARRARPEDDRDLRALYPRDTEDQAVLRPLTRRRTAAPYERARLAAGALAARVGAARRAERLGSRPRPYAVAVPAASRSHPRAFHDGRKEGRLLEPEPGVDIDAVERPPDPRSRRRGCGRHAPGQPAGARSRPRPASAARSGGSPAAAHSAAWRPVHTGPNHRRSHVSTPEEQPSPGEALARARAARGQMAAALDEPVGWQPIWQRPRKPKSQEAKKEELSEQHRRFQEAAGRRLAAKNSRRPRPWQNRIVNAVARCAA
ncbi:MobF family relaxase [Streptomyces sp. NPDC085460]|uniref:MobF family relaxase n=1 Tax=Streptomyces sp. NPDC085460 TaxID=3365723 RepID=UPI0037D704C2